MMLASELKEGMVIKLPEGLFRVISAEYHAGGGKMPGVVHSKLKNIKTGAIWERRFRPEEKVEDIMLERQNLEYLYNDGQVYYFMNPETFDQIPVSEELVGRIDRFLQPNMQLAVEFYDGQPVSVLFPEFVDLKVVSTAAGLHEQDNTLKPAILENGMEVLVPQFIKEGEIVRVSVETGKYVERVRAESKKT